METSNFDVQSDGLEFGIKVGRDGDGDGLCNEDGQGHGIPCAPTTTLSNIASSARAAGSLVGELESRISAGELIGDLEDRIKPTKERKNPARAVGAPSSPIKESRSAKILKSLPYKPGDPKRALPEESKSRGLALQFDTLGGLTSEVGEDAGKLEPMRRAVRKFLGFKEDETSQEYVEAANSFWKNMLNRTMRRKTDQVFSQNPQIATSTEALLQVLEDGRYKSQFETGSSEGWYSPNERRKIESEFLGIPTDIDDDKRPIYGYMPLLDSEGKLKHPAYYGEHAVILKDDVRERTTASFGDTLDHKLVGISLTEPVSDIPDDRLEAAFVDYWSAEPLRYEMINALSHSDQVDFSIDDLDTPAYAGTLNGWTYVEAQVHGGVSLEDIEKVGIKISDSPKTEQLVKSLEEAGIPWFDLDDPEQTIRTLAESDGKLPVEPSRTKEVLDDLGYTPGEVKPNERYVRIGNDMIAAFARDMLQKSKENGFTIRGFNPTSDDKETQEIELAEFLKDRLPKATQEWFDQYVPDRVTHIATTSEALDQILEDGRFKSQHETLSSKGSLQPERRSAYELADLGIPEDIDPEKRPIYGYVPRINVMSGKPAQAPSHYGEHTVRLKPDVNDRSTITFGDSLDAATPVAMNSDFEELDPDEILAFNASMNAAFYNMAEELTGVNRDDGGLGIAPNFSYIESQVHGGVSLEDIESVGLSLPDIERMEIPNKRGSRERLDQFDLTDGDDWIDLVDHTESAEELIQEIQARLEKSAKALEEKGIPFNFEFLDRIPGITTQQELNTDWWTAKYDLAETLRKAYDNFSNKEWRAKYEAEQQAILDRRTAEVVARREAEAARLAELGLSEDDFD